jgi:hypothetical protein
MITQECSAVSFCEEEKFILEIIRGMLTLCTAACDLFILKHQSLRGMVQDLTGAHKKSAALHVAIETRVYSNNNDQSESTIVSYLTIDQ